MGTLLQNSTKLRALVRRQPTMEDLQLLHNEQLSALLSNPEKY